MNMTSGSSGFQDYRAGVPSPCHQLPDTWGLWTQAKLYLGSPAPACRRQIVVSFSVSINMKSIYLIKPLFLSIYLSSIHRLSISIIYSSPSILSISIYPSVISIYPIIYLLSIYLSIIYLYLYILSVLFLWGPLTHIVILGRIPVPGFSSIREAAHISGTVIPFHLKASTASQASAAVSSGSRPPPLSALDPWNNPRLLQKPIIKTSTTPGELENLGLLHQWVRRS